MRNTTSGFQADAAGSTLHVTVTHDTNGSRKRSGGCIFNCSSKDSDVYIVKVILDEHCWDVRKRTTDFEMLETRLHKLIPRVAESLGVNTTAEKLMDQMPELPPKKSFWNSDPGPEFHLAVAVGHQKYIESAWRMSRRFAAAEAASGARLTGPFDHEISTFLNMQFELKQKRVALAPIGHQEKAQLVIEKEAYKERSEELERERAQDTVKEDKNKRDLFQQLSEMEDEIEDAMSRISSVVDKQDLAPGAER